MVEWSVNESVTLNMLALENKTHHCRCRNQASIIAVYIVGWCKVEDTVWLILITSTCAAFGCRGAKHRLWRMGGWLLSHAKDRQLKYFRWGRRTCRFVLHQPLHLRMKLEKRSCLTGILFTEKLNDNFCLLLSFIINGNSVQFTFILYW